MKKKRMLIILILGVTYAPFALADSMLGQVKDYDNGSVACAFGKNKSSDSSSSEKKSDKKQSSSSQESAE